MNPKSEAEQKVEAMEFIAPIVEAQMRFDQGITNRLMSDAWTAAAEWAERFADLMRSVEKANDSMRVAHILDAHWRPDIDRQIRHYRTMAGEEAGVAS